MHTERVQAAPTLALALLGSALAVVVGSVLVSDGSFAAAATACALAAAAAVTLVRVIPWRGLIAAIVLVVLFIPIRRYIIGVEGPFQLEPYRLLLGLVLCGWLASLLVNPRVRLRRTGVEGPLLLVLLATFGSIVANGARVGSMGPDVAKSLVFFLSFVLFLYLLVSVVGVHDVAFILRVLVAGGVVVAVLAVIETRTGSTPFTSLSTYLPFMDLNPDFEPALNRGARVRAFGPAEHPIALGAALAMLIPASLYLARVGRRIVWMGASLALLVGSLATVSRTVLLMLVAMGIFYLFIQPRSVMRLWPLLIVLVVATHFVAPGTLGTLRDALTPQGGLVEQQRGAAGSTGSGRIADLSPSLELWAQQPILGQGFGTRVTTGPTANAFILDNQWLGTLLEVGAVGAVAWAWLLLRVLRRTRRAAREKAPGGELVAALGAAVAGYGAAMFTFDAFSFVQVTLFLFLLIGLACVVLEKASREPTVRLRPAVVSQAARLGP